MPQKLTLVHIALDISPSMDERDIEGRDVREGEAPIKLVVAYKGVKKALEKVVTDLWDSVSETAPRRFISIGYFGVRGYNDSETYLLMQPISLKELREKYHSQAGKILEFTVDDLKSKDRYGTDAAQLLRSLEAALELLGEREKELGRGETTFEKRIVLIVFSDSCFNLWRGEAVDGIEAAKRLREGLDALAPRYGAAWRIRFVALYGDPSRVEDDDGICPVRAAIYASSRDELIAKYETLWRTVEDMRRNGVIVLDPEWKDQIIEVDGVEKPITDYAVGRVREPEHLMQLILGFTTQ